jgi:hypothetical protein
MNLAPAFLENTYTVEFYHLANNLTVCVDVVSPNKDLAVEFARTRFSLKESQWDLVGSDPKYKEGRNE